MVLMFGEKLFDGEGSAIAYHIDIAIPSSPNIFEQLFPSNFIDFDQLFPQPIEGIPKGGAPFLMPFTTATAATVTSPALYTVSTAPGRDRFKFKFPGGGNRLR